MKQAQKSFNQIFRHGNRKAVTLNPYVDNKTSLGFGLSTPCLQLSFSPEGIAGSGILIPYAVEEED